MNLERYQDMQLLHEVAQNPQITQRDLGKRIGAALGLTNSRLHRLCTKGLIKITDTDKKRVRYLVTREGILEKNQLISEYLADCLSYYSDLRKFLREELERFKRQRLERVLLVGTGVIAEVAYLTIEEEGLKLVGVFGDDSAKSTFFHLPVSDISDLNRFDFDRVIVATLRSRGEVVQRLLTMGIPPVKIVQAPGDDALFPAPGSTMHGFLPSFPPAGANAAVRPAPVKREGRAEGHSGSVEVVSAFKHPTAATTDVVVLCGGRGTRLGSLTTKVPKPLLPVAGEPFLRKLLLRLKGEGFSRFILSGHYLADRFRYFVAEHQAELGGLELVIEPEALGTGGALRYAADRVATSPLLVINGDSWVEQPLTPVLEDHARFDREFTVVAVQADRVQGEARKKGVWRIGPDREAAGFATQESVVEGWVNAGCYVIDHAMISLWPLGSYSLEANLPILLTGRRTGVFCSEGRLLDIGTSETYSRAAKTLEQFTAHQQGMVPA